MMNDGIDNESSDDYCKPVRDSLWGGWWGRGGNNDEDDDDDDNDEEDKEDGDDDRKRNHVWLFFVRHLFCNLHC